MSATYEGRLEGAGMRVAIAASRFNRLVTDGLLDGARIVRLEELVRSLLHVRLHAAEVAPRVVGVNARGGAENARGGAGRLCGHES